MSQFRDAWRAMCSPGPAPRFEAGDGVDYIFSGLPVAFFNVALVTARDVSGQALAAMGERACAWAAPTSLPWLFVVTHEAVASGVNATSVLAGSGLVPMLPMTGMIANTLSPGTSVPDGLHLEVPADDAGCAAMLDVNGAAYGVDLEAGRPLFGRPAFWADHVPVLGRTGGTPVASAAVLMADGYRYVALVATEPAHQRRGYAEAAMRHALDVAAQRHGARPSFLHATDAGRPIYARMGYRPVASHTAFIDKRFLDGH
ncbi:MAG TPA: GNAT family N-acetyltransferase [Vicinamibacterales bacterium]